MDRAHLGHVVFPLGGVAMSMSRWSRRWRGLARALLVLLLVAGAFGLAAQETKRKVKSRVVPSYPALARERMIEGRVKIEVVVTPEGRVRSTRVIGGHPVLVPAAEAAVKKWTFHPGTEESTEIIEFVFNL